MHGLLHQQGIQGIHWHGAGVVGGVVTSCGSVVGAGVVGISVVISNYFEEKNHFS